MTMRRRPGPGPAGPVSYDEVQRVLAAAGLLAPVTPARQFG
jgi:hypothetical protein